MSFMAFAGDGSGYCGRDSIRRKARRDLKTPCVEDTISQWTSKMEGHSLCRRRHSQFHKETQAD